MTINAFTKLVNEHDLTYEYSDDGRSWRRGCVTLSDIKAMSATMDIGDVTRIWNANVDRRIQEEYRSPFYWKA